jgi:demethoxyubiquinone hydroxylase (CLK1/Coq7/Cat5 family)
VTETAIDLKAEQQASLERPRLKYSAIAKMFFWGMDLITGKQTTVAKAKLIETLASIPYRAWEIRQYAIMTRVYNKLNLVKQSADIMNWSREAQDNEYWHLVVLNEKMKEDNAQDPWYLKQPMPFLVVLSYVIITRTIALFNIKAAFRFNAAFEDHAEHVYAQFMADNPGLDDQPMDNPVVKEYGSELKTWGDVVRRIGLDERDHMNNSFIFAGEPEKVIKYAGMPPSPVKEEGLNF